MSQMRHPASADFCGVSSTVLLDANAVVNAALLPQCFSAYAVALAKQHQACRFLVSAGVMREVRNTPLKTTADEERRRLAEMRIVNFLDWLSASQTDDDDLSPAPASIPKADGHVFHAARCHSATVLTSDAALWLGLRECNVPSLLPVEWIRQIDGMALASTIFGVPPTAAVGSLFVPFIPAHGLAGSQASSRPLVSLADSGCISMPADRVGWPR